MGTVIDINTRKKRASRPRKQERLVQIWTRVDPSLKKEIDGLAKTNGLSPSQYMRVLMSVAVEEHWTFRPVIQQHSEQTL